MSARAADPRERGISSGDLELPSLETGGLVDRTKAGLRDLASASRQTDPATSAALSVDEVVALAQVGYRPVGVVSGTAVARLGYNGEWSLRPGRNYEVPNLTKLLNNSRNRAVLRMREQCQELGGIGVVGARIDLEGVEHEGVATFVATGTAVQHAQAGTSVHRVPFTCSLDGHDLNLLVRGGAVPRSLVIGASAFHFGWRSPARWTRSQGRCIELRPLTQSLYGAREAAIERLVRRASDAEADGVIDVKVVERARVWSRHIIEFVAFGTAVSFDANADTLGEFGTWVALDDPGSRDGRQRQDTFTREAPTQSALR